jgi:hypothetical protein
VRDVFDFSASDNLITPSVPIGFSVLREKKDASNIVTGEIKLG